MIWAKNKSGGHRVAARLDFPYLPNSYICLADAYCTVGCTLTLQLIGVHHAIYWGGGTSFGVRNNQSKSEYQATCTSARIALHAGAIPHQPGIAAFAAHLTLAVVHPGEPGLVQVTLCASRRRSARAPRFSAGRRVAVAEESGRAGGG